MSDHAENNKQAVWAIEATISPQPLYRPDGLNERGWAKRQLKYLPSETKVYWLPYFRTFFHRRETDYSECVLEESSAMNSGGFLRIAGYHPKRPPLILTDGTPFLEQHVGLIWLGKWHVCPVIDPHLVDLMMQRVWASWYFSQDNFERSKWLLNWAGSAEAKAKLEEAMSIIQSWQQERR